MAIEPFIPSSVPARRNGERFVQMRAQLEDLQRQMATGRKADSFADLGVSRRISLDSRAKISALEGWNKTIEQGELRISVMTRSLEGFAKEALDGKSDARPGAYVPSANGQVPGQILARNRLAQSLDMLNAEVDGRYLFSGRTHDVKPVERLETILDGDGAGRVGATQMMNERRLADAGVADMGRLVSGVAGTTVSLAREGANPPYGFTIRGAASQTPNVAATFVAGPPASMSFNVLANPEPGSRVSLQLDLPDGTTQTITLEARGVNVGGPPETGFAIGATPADTALNLRASLDAAIQRETRTSLHSASAMIGARAFFAGSASNPPLRVPGPGFATAVAPPAPAAPNTTVIWYRGDDDPAVSARNTGPLQIAEGQVVAAGARANEEAFREGLAAFAAFATVNLNSSDPNSRDRYEALAERVRVALAFPTTQSPRDITVEIGAAEVAMKSARERHRTSLNVLETVRAGVEDAKDEEVASALLALQTRLQASYQTTSILTRLTLVNYLG
jgi:flagellin-like hook-associated protein FlgL